MKKAHLKALALIGAVATMVSGCSLIDRDIKDFDPSNEYEAEVYGPIPIDPQTDGHRSFTSWLDKLIPDFNKGDIDEDDELIEEELDKNQQQIYCVYGPAPTE